MNKYIRVKGLLLCAGIVLSLMAHASDEQSDFGLRGLTYDGPYDEAIVNGGIHILAQQCDDGGWGWPHNVCGSTAYNITSPIIDGVLAAYNASELSVFLDSAVEAADFNLGATYGGSGAGAGSPMLASQTALNLWNMTAKTGDNTYTDWVINGFYEPLLAGTYGANADYDVAGYIAAVRSSGTWTNLKAWEFANQVLAAERYCYQGISDQFEQAILDALASLDNTDPGAVYSDILGVVGAVQGLANVNRLTFPEIAAPKHLGVNGETTLEGLADYLASLQNANGSFYWHSNLTAPDSSDEDVQTTAYAVLALVKAQERLSNKNYLPAIEAAKVWLASLQEADGSFPSSTGGNYYNTEIIAEAVHALSAEGVYDRIFKGQMECYVN